MTEAMTEPATAEPAPAEPVTAAPPTRRLRWAWTAKVSRPVLGWILVGVGAVFIALGYWGVAHETLVAKQIPYLVSGGIGGMVVVAVGAFLLGTYDVRRQLDRVERLETLVHDLHTTLLEPLAASEAAASVNGFVALDRGRSYHRADCSMVAGKDAHPVAPSTIADRELRPCGVCEPAS